MEWPINEVTRITGTTSRTLRHYGQIGLLEPSRTGAGGYRYYDEDALLRLQRILLLRELGLGLPAIAEVLAGGKEVSTALGRHLVLLEQERDRIDRQIASVRRTIEKREGGEQLMAEEMFDGFDHTRYKEEVEQRWGKEAYAAGDRWWSSLDPEEKRAWQERATRLGSDWTTAAERGVTPESDEAQDLARRHFEWLRGIPGTPGAGSAGPSKEYFVGLGEMYVADPRFGANYGGEQGAVLVRDAMKVYAERNL
ncbi:MerR family transcriptional regulator [Georgenia subflava]|uniref:MerR family transcriptional regulator n=1 Tax=Georgenia subflava TaxID=1622177 RepID=A0A6N7ENJ3_9MICO|nr:TipAS antibiotic-recognition domain-containing protein [Georgenia subflava]MPV36794.1 MerR family transcriptional regulator [Georgenia subflava]